MSACTGYQHALYPMISFPVRVGFARAHVRMPSVFQYRLIAFQFLVRWQKL